MKSLRNVIARKPLATVAISNYLIIGIASSLPLLAMTVTEFQFGVGVLHPAVRVETQRVRGEEHPGQRKFV